MEKNIIRQGSYSIVSAYAKNQVGVTGLSLDDLLHPMTGNPIKIGFVEAHTCTTGSNIDKIVRTAVESAHSGDYDIVLAPEYSMLPESGPIPESEKVRYSELFSFAGRNGSLMIPGTIVWTNGDDLFNTALVAYDGKTHEYHKVKDGGESRLARRNGLKAGFGTEIGLFNWNGLDCGIEICCDGGIIAKQGVRDLDMMFLISAGNNNLEKSMLAVKEGGYGVVVDGFWQIYGVKKKT